MINNRHEKYWACNKQAFNKIWENLPIQAREVIARDTDHTSKSLEYFIKAVNRETDRLFKNEV